jgi:small-conductance mechanosensitive channel
MYLVLKICGLTRLALTMVGGTGLVGLVIGIAFRDITENFLASVLLSVQSPFRKGDLIELAGVLGVVQQLNVRTTVLMSLAGHLVQLPNALVYKSTIRNFTSIPNRREDFTLGIGYEVPIDQAQEVALKVLAEHPAVLKSPESWVLVDDLGPTTVNLRVYFWLDGSKTSWLKAKSSVIRLVKRAFQDHHITLPDDLRKVVFPQEVPVRIIKDRPSLSSNDEVTLAHDDSTASRAASLQAEGGLGTEAGQIKAQADQARRPDEGEDLLHAPTPGPLG